MAYSLMREAPVVVVMVPLPAQGHLNQLLHFSRILAARQISVHYVGSATHNRQVKERVQGWNPKTMSNIHFHDFPLPQFLNPPPDPEATNKFPAHFQPTFDASMHLRQPLAELLRSLASTSRRVVVIHDTLMAFASLEAQSIPNAESYAFRSVSAFACLVHQLKSNNGNNGRASSKGVVIPHDLPINCFSNQFLDFINRQFRSLSSTAGELFNTCSPVEGPYLDLLGQKPLLVNKKRWAVGPLNPVSINIVGANSSPYHRRHKCLEWLDKQAMDSVLYVSFGTMTSLSDAQIGELAIGLERSKQRFIWVLREADRGDIYAEDEKEVRRIELPHGYEERVSGVGEIVRDWAPQLDILAHSSTGGFMSHCGWNSCMESMSMGVPIAAWPMHSDQPSNTILVTQVLKVGIVVREWERREELVSSTDVESAVRKLMASDEGKSMRARAKTLGVDVCNTVLSKEGTSTAELDSFIAHISRDS
ncbi:hypothetical protein Scep_014031 [Stephania cephalantha]|uniref:Glycosyltransferase n=1 Tax=Stephania cephalantha TaxID=152367 RepID=A0AAP0P1A0_9MAGN